MKYKVTLSTVVEFVADVDADDEDTAIDKALKSAKQFGNQYHSGPGWIVDVNNEWQYEDPTAEPS